MPALAADPTIRRQVMSAAREVLAEDAGAPVAVIADRAGVSRATFYRHFGSRASLLAERRAGAATGGPRADPRRREGHARDDEPRRAVDGRARQGRGRVARHALPDRAGQGGAARGPDRGVLAVRGGPLDHRRPTTTTRRRSCSRSSAATIVGRRGRAARADARDLPRDHVRLAPGARGHAPALPADARRARASTSPARWPPAGSGRCTRSSRSRRSSGRSSST